jgi:hypothetical protein
MSYIEIRFKRGEEWESFPVGDILHMPLRHACHLFSGVFPVVVKQSGAYVVNSDDLQKQYRIKRCRVYTFADILASSSDRLDKKLSEVGFI